MQNVLKGKFIDNIGGSLLSHFFLFSMERFGIPTMSERTDGWRVKMCGWKLLLETEKSFLMLIARVKLVDGVTGREFIASCVGVESFGVGGN